MRVTTNKRKENLLDIELIESEEVVLGTQFLYFPLPSP